MSGGFRFEIEAFPHPEARERLTDGGLLQLVRVRLFDPPSAEDDRGLASGTPDAFTDLRPGDARHLAAELIAAARHAELVTAAAGAATAARRERAR